MRPSASGCIWMWNRRILIQRSMRPKTMVRGKVVGQEAREMPFMEDEDMVQTLLYA